MGSPYILAMPTPRKSRIFKSIDASPDVLIHTPHTKTFSVTNDPFAIYWPNKYTVEHIETVCKGNRAVLKMTSCTKETWHLVHLKPKEYRTLDPYVLLRKDTIRDSYSVDKNGPLGFQFNTQQECLQFIESNYGWLSKY